MKTKLTLTVDEDVVERAKNSLGQTSKSLSSVVENFLRGLTMKKKKFSAVDASRGILKKKYGSLKDKEIRGEYYKDKHGV